ncbi:MAG: lantibiotic dehydratase [Myxococcota bacterium]|nr:hypothetical protein [Deltaproteobacteria bacterium]MDQ3334967.1 lantibiotic dehydratase [Myxococcota bacterium]
MTHDRHALAPLFAVRAAGVPFQVLERLGTPAVSAAARRLNAFGATLDEAAEAALATVAIELASDRKLRSKVSQKLSRRSVIVAELANAHPWLAAYAQAHAAREAALEDLEAMIDREYATALDALSREAGRVLPDFLLLESAPLLDEVRKWVTCREPANRSIDRQRHRTLAMYLQRVCAKNDSFSRFGPTMWGTIEPGEGIALHPRPGMARRVELETWVVARLVAIIEADPDVRAELAPRLHGHGQLEQDAFVRLDEQREHALSTGERALVAACDGVRPACELGDPTTLASLAERGVIVWRLERYARDTAPFASLLADIDGWRDPVRERWRTRLQPLVALVERFAADERVASRRAVLDELHANLQAIGVADRERTRTLYAATNPINENCTLHSTISLGAAACDRLLADVWPWLELWHDATAFAVSRVYQRVAELVAVAPRRAGKLPYSSLLHTARAAGFDLDRDGGLTDVARGAWDDVQRELSELLGRRPDAPVWQLTAEDCTFLRRRYELPPPGEIGRPSLDLLACATSAADAAAGRFDWLVGESHHGFPLYQHTMYWGCPDKTTLTNIIRAAAGDAPVASRDSGNDLPVHINYEAFLATGVATFVGAARTRASWKVVRPADAEVVVDEGGQDIRLRAPSGEDLGSLIRTAATVMGMHPFFPLVRAPHEPRLRLGAVTVQRRSWYVDSSELGAQRTGMTASFVSALERVRADRGIPRWVYVRPRPGVLNSTKTNRDKDNKPVCIDLESVISLYIFEHRLRKYEAMILTEMLPAPEQIFLDTGDGPVLFELRTNVVPRDATQR